MTREEAIKVLKHTVGNINYDAEREEIYFTHEWVGAYEMAISALREQPCWISVEEALPETEDTVLCVTKNKRPFVCRYDHYWKHWRVSKSVKVTHWMPLPSTEGLNEA